MVFFKMMYTLSMDNDIILIRETIVNISIGRRVGRWKSCIVQKDLYI